MTGKELQNIRTIRRILDAHSIPHYVKDGRIYADSMIAGTEKFECVEDCTDWSRQELFSWLGY